MRRVPTIAMLCAACAASLPSHGEESAASIGRQLAAGSAIRWNVGEVMHPLLGPIKFAAQASDIVTAVGNEKIFSKAYVSCQKGSAKIAIELTNAPGSALAEGLGPVDLPRLVCNVPGPQGRAAARSEIAASWEIGALGDTLARGLAPAALRRCASVDVLQNLVLPAGWGQESQRVAMTITPYARELDAVLTECGEATAYAQAEARPAEAPAPAARPERVTASERTPRREELPWKAARTIAKGRSNVRAAAKLDSPVVAHLDPGARILVQPASAPWWRVKPRTGAGFNGFIREDRLKLERPGG